MSFLILLKKNMLTTFLTTARDDLQSLIRG